jgi:hypothetical protein
MEEPLHATIDEHCIGVDTVASISCIVELKDDIIEQVVGAVAPPALVIEQESEETTLVLLQSLEIELVLSQRTKLVTLS